MLLYFYRPNLVFVELYSDNTSVAKYKGQDLMKVCVNSSKAYDFGKNSIKFRGLLKVVTAGGFGVRFYFDKNLLEERVTKKES